MLLGGNDPVFGVSSVFANVMSKAGGIPTGTMATLECLRVTDRATTPRLFECRI